jgi:hypothetical protein
MSRPTRAWAWVPRMLDIFLRALPHAVPGRRGAKMTKTWRPIPPQHPTTPCHNDWAASRLQSARPSWTRTDDSSTKAPPQGQRERGSAGRAPPRRGPSGSCHFGERQAQCDQLSSPSQQAIMDIAGLLPATSTMLREVAGSLPATSTTTTLLHDWAASRLQSARPSWTRTDDSTTTPGFDSQRK